MTEVRIPEELDPKICINCGINIPDHICLDCYKVVSEIPDEDLKAIGMSIESKGLPYPTEQLLKAKNDKVNTKILMYPQIPTQEECDYDASSSFDLSEEEELAGYINQPSNINLPEDFVESQEIDIINIENKDESSDL